MRKKKLTPLEEKFELFTFFISDIENYIEKRWILEKLPERKEDSNKGTYGKVLIIAGSREVYGAVYLAAEAAYRVGAGLVKVVTDIRNRDTLCEKIPEAMLLTYDSEEKGTLIKTIKQKST